MNYRAFLNEHNGNPNKKNNSNETALHAVCSLSPQSPYSAQERRAACVTILLNWQGVELSDGRREKIRLSVQNNVIQPKINIIFLKYIKMVITLIGWKHCIASGSGFGFTVLC